MFGVRYGTVVKIQDLDRLLTLVVPDTSAKSAGFEDRNNTVLGIFGAGAPNWIATFKP